MLEDDRRRAGWSVGQVAWRLGVSVPEYQAIEAGDRSPNFETWAGSANCWRGRRGSLAEGVEMPDWAFIVVPVALRPIDSADCEAHSSLIVDLRTQGGPHGLSCTAASVAARKQGGVGALRGGEDHERTPKGGPRESSEAGGMDSLGASPARGRSRGSSFKTPLPRRGQVAPRLPSECCP